jgi:spore maturation protein CgeB
MKVLYLSKNLKNYKSANYQKEFLKALSKITSVYVFGPGSADFDCDKTVDDIISHKGPFDCIFVGHYWLQDGDQSQIDPWPQSDLAKSSHKKFLFLNKEYANLNKKLQWIKKNKFDCVFSHHQNCQIWQSKTKTKFKYLPFAYDENLFNFFENKRKYDLAFSGVLQNPRGNSLQSDIRVRILKKLYYTFFDIPLFKKKKYRHLSIFWNSVPKNFIGQILSRIFKTHKFLDIKSYSQIQKNSKIYLNCKSPLNLISPRYFENIASGCLVMTEKNNELKKLLPNLSYIEFFNDLSNFDKVLSKSINLFDSSKKKRKDYAKIIKKKHSWHVRSKEVLKLIKFYIK